MATTPTFGGVFLRVSFLDASSQNVPNTVSGTTYPANTAQLVVRFLGRHYTAHLTCADAAGLVFLHSLWRRNSFSVTDAHLLTMQFRGDGVGGNVWNVSLQYNDELIGCLPLV